MPPKTPAERKMKQKQRLKESGAYEEFKKKERERRKELRMKKKSTADVEKLEAMRRTKREEMRKYREKQRVSQALFAETETGPAETPSKAFKSRSACGKAVARVKKNLPLSPKRRTAVITKLAQQIVPHVLSPKSTKQRSDGLSPELKDTIMQFYLRDDISRQSPGMNDTKIVRQSDGSKDKVQVRHLYNSIVETHAIFSEEYGYVVGKSKFAELRPQHVLLSSQQPHNVCLCKYHENFILAVNALAKKIENFPEYSNRFLSTFLCEDPTEDCWMSRCDQCRDKIETAITKATAGTKKMNLKWKTWKEEGRLRIVEEDGTMQVLVEHILHQVPTFKEHCYVKRMQAKSYQQARENAINKVMEKSALLQIDFAENYTCIAQNEIQSYHWGQPQVSLFTASLWYNDEQHPIVIASDSLVHTKETVVPYLDCLLEELPEGIKNIHIWSDGPASQFKNRFIAAALLQLELRHNCIIEWNYFATSPGKGPVDGIGGALKRKIRSCVLRGQIVSNAKEFHAVAQQNSNIKVITMDQYDFDTRNESLGMKIILENAPPLKNVSKMHKIYREHSGKVVGRMLSSHITSEVYEDGERPSTSSTNIGLSSSVPSVNTIKNGTYVTVQFENINKKGQTPDIYTYAAICQSSVDGEGDVKIMILKLSDNNMFKVDENDISFVQFEKITKILPQPSIVLRGNRILYKFNCEVEVFEKP